jgi:hypothetical protein
MADGYMWTGKYVEVRRAYFKTFQHLPEGTDENHEKYVCMYGFRQASRPVGNTVQLKTM